MRFDDYKMRDTDFSFTFNKKEAKQLAKHEYTYGDPVPSSMRTIRLEDLAAVDINWRMLTMLRPANKLEEDIFSRLVELGKLRLSTERYEAKILASSANAAPGSQNLANLANMGIIVSKNKRGVMETRCKVCKECGEELCTGAWCKEFPYESYTRMLLDKDELERQEQEEAGGVAVNGEAGRRASTNKKGAGKDVAAKAKRPTRKPIKPGKGKRKKKKGKNKKQKTSGSESDD